MANIEHTITLQIPQSMWQKALEGFRALRQILKDSGGASRLVKKGETLTFTASGPDIAVLDAIANAKRLQDAIAKQRQSTVDMLKDAIIRGKEQRARREEDFLGMLADELLKRGK